MTIETCINGLTVAHPYIPKNLLEKAVTELIDDYGYDLEDLEAIFEENFCGVWPSWSDYVQESLEDNCLNLSRQDWERVRGYFDYEKYGDDLKHDMICVKSSEGAIIFHWH